MHLPCTDQNEIKYDPSHLGVPSGASKMISEPMVHSPQIVHLSCIKISIISKRNETSTHFSLVTKEFHLVRPKWFLSLRYVRCKPCIHLLSRLALSPNGLNRAYPWAPSPRSTIAGVSKMSSEPMVRLAQNVHLSWTNTSTVSKQTESSLQLSLVT
jgi:hypothetical protein